MHMHIRHSQRRCTCYHQPDLQTSFILCWTSTYNRYCRYCRYWRYCRCDPNAARASKEGSGRQQVHILNASSKHLLKLAVLLCKSAVDCSSPERVAWLGKSLGKWKSTICATAGLNVRSQGGNGGQCVASKVQLSILSAFPFSLSLMSEMHATCEVIFNTPNVLQFKKKLCHLYLIGSDATQKNCDIVYC